MTIQNIQQFTPGTRFKIAGNVYPGKTFTVTGNKSDYLTASADDRTHETGTDGNVYIFTQINFNYYAEKVRRIGGTK